MTEQEQGYVPNDVQRQLHKLRMDIETNRVRLQRAPNKTPADREIAGTVLPLLDQLATCLSHAEHQLGVEIESVADRIDGAPDTQIHAEDATKILYVVEAAEQLAKKALEQGGMDAAGTAECERIIKEAGEVRELIAESTVEMDGNEEDEDEEGGDEDEDESVTAPGGSA